MAAAHPLTNTVFGTSGASVVAVSEQSVPISAIGRLTSCVTLVPSASEVVTVRVGRSRTMTPTLAAERP